MAKKRRSGKATGLTSTLVRELEAELGHTFTDRERLTRALTHSSAATGRREIAHYERLEFLGDRVLGLCAAELLFAAFPDEREGELAVRFNNMVSGEACAIVADRIGLARFIQADASAAQLAGKHMKSVRADVVESLIAAIHLDAGLPAAKAFIERHWGERVHLAGAGTQDAKTALQEWAHVAHGATPHYAVTARSGPDHDPRFVVDVTIAGAQGAQGKGRSKRAAEQDAAQAILLRENVWMQAPDGAVQEVTS